MEASPEAGQGARTWSRSYVALAAWLTLAAALIALGFASTSQVDERGDERDVLFDPEFAVGSLIAYGVIVGLTVWIARSFGNVRLALGLRSFPARWVWITLGLTFLSLVVSSLLEPILHAGEKQGLAPTEWHSDRAGVFAVNAVVVAIVVPFAEELFFRGLGVRVLGFLGANVAIIGTALVFALAHGLLVAIPALGFFGLALAWVRYRTESVWPGFIAHALYNGIGVLVAAYLAREEREAATLVGLLL